MRLVSSMSHEGLKTKEMGKTTMSIFMTRNSSALMGLVYFR